MVEAVAAAALMNNTPHNTGPTVWEKKNDTVRKGRERKHSEKSAKAKIEMNGA